MGIRHPIRDHLHVRDAHVYDYEILDTKLTTLGGIARAAQALTAIGRVHYVRTDCHYIVQPIKSVFSTRNRT